MLGSSNLVLKLPSPVHDAETTLNRMMPRKDNNTGVLRPVPRPLAMSVFF